MIWDYFEKAFVINLDSRPDRLEQITSRLDALGIEFERFSAIRPEDRNGFANVGYYGATLSHLQLWREIYERGYETALIFEDDAIFRDDTNTIMKTALSQLGDIDWELIYLGAVPYKLGKRLASNIRVMIRGCHLHAYGVRREHLQKLIQCGDEALIRRKVVDVAVSEFGITRMLVQPVVAVQAVSPSDTGGADNRLDEYFSYFSAKEFLANCQELA